MTSHLDKKLAEIKDRCDAATPGPWEYEVEVSKYYDQTTGKPYENFFRWIKGGEFKTRLASVHGTNGNFDAEGDFIAHSRTDIELFVAIIKRQNEALRDVFQLSNLSDDSQLVGVCDKAIADIEKLIEGDEK